MLHLFKEHHLEQVREVEALMVWTEGYSEFLSLPRVHESLNWSNTEYALPVVVLCACGQDGLMISSVRTAPRRPSAFLRAPCLHDLSCPVPRHIVPSFPSTYLLMVLCPCGS